MRTWLAWLRRPARLVGETSRFWSMERSLNPLKSLNLGEALEVEVVVADDDVVDVVVDVAGGCC